MVSNEASGRTARLLVLHLPAGTAASDPGRFVMLACSAQPGAPLLRRPFSLLEDEPAPDGGRHVSILYEVMGQGTRLLAQARPGDRRQVLGPLGNRFTLPTDAVEGVCVLVAGGVGVAPFPFLARQLSESGRDVTLVLGARDRAHLYQLERFRDLGVEILTITDAGDGPSGDRGLVTDALNRYLGLDGATTDLPVPVARVYACGPEPMLKAVVNLARRAGLRGEVSMERHMACGWGVCWTCVCPQREPGEAEFYMRRTCVNGPVVDLEWLPEGDW